MYFDECVVLEFCRGLHLWRVSPSPSQLSRVPTILCRRLIFETGRLKNDRERSGSAQPRTGMGVLCFNLNLPVDLTDQTCERKVEFLHEVERSIFLPIPQSVTSKRSIALLPTLARWLKWWSPPFVMEWEEGDVIPRMCVRSTVVGGTEIAVCDAFFWRDVVCS